MFILVHNIYGINQNWFKIEHSQIGFGVCFLLFLNDILWYNVGKIGKKNQKTVRSHFFAYNSVWIETVS